MNVQYRQIKYQYYGRHFMVLRNGLGLFALIVEWFQKKSKVNCVSRSECDQKRLDQKTRNIVLYELRSCTECSKVRREMIRQNVKLEIRNASKYETYRKELLKGGGKTQFPCLTYKDSSGKKYWVYETNEILDQIRRIAA